MVPARMVKRFRPSSYSAELCSAAGTRVISLILLICFLRSVLDASARIDLDNGAGLVFQGTTWANNGVINLANGTLEFGGDISRARMGTINRTGGTLRKGSATGSPVVFDGSGLAYLTVAEGAAGLFFVPAANANGRNTSGGFTASSPLTSLRAAPRTATNVIAPLASRMPSGRASKKAVPMLVAKAPPGISWPMIWRDELESRCAKASRDARRRPRGGQERDRQ